MNNLRDMIQYDLSKKKNDSPSIERVLGGQVSYKLVSKHGYNSWPAWAHERVA
jgi:hypothetical protein